ncbi:MAG: MBL fold metallo-hydrolase [Alphaproteobacteria bacterium]|nr:MBL fold metallo-hydrolase [Alphaproteobacteria bacterium]HPF46784.1 MBL fold metallo-hydrolase [Emcibacteraceae bacterium]
MKITILGSGTSQGVPRIGGKLNNGWGLCDPNNPKNRRRRVSIMVEEGDTRVIVDTGPDFREQALSAGITTLDAVLYTHDHADHTHGIDDLRAFSQNMNKRVPIYSNKHTLKILQERFGYIFKGRKNYDAICEAHEIDLAPFRIGGFDIQPMALVHGAIFSYGYRFGKMCYCTDFNDIPKETYKHLYDLDLWIVDCLREEPHPTHCHLEQTLGYIEEFKPKRAVLTHMTAELDYETLKNKLPKGVEPAYDGLVLNI